MIQIHLHTERIYRLGGWHYFQVQLPENASTITSIKVSCDLMVGEIPTKDGGSIPMGTSEFAAARVAGLIRLVRPDHTGAFFSEQVIAEQILTLPELTMIGNAPVKSWSRLHGDRYHEINMPVTATFIDVIYKNESLIEGGYNIKIYLQYETAL